MCPETGPVKIVTHTKEAVPIHVYRLVLVTVGTTVTPHSPHSRDGSTGVVTGVFTGC